MTGRNAHFQAGAGVRVEHVTGQGEPYVSAKVDGVGEVGALEYWELHGKKNALGVSSVDVDPTYQRRGVATAMYDHLLSRYPHHVIYHDVPNMSNEAQNLGDTLAQRHPGRHKFVDLEKEL